MDQTVAALILAGGRSSRMGRDKRRLRLWGEHGPTLLERTVSLVQPLVAATAVVLPDPEAWEQLQVLRIADTWPHQGPLGGIASGMQLLQQPWFLVLACDLPGLSHVVLETLLTRTRPASALVPVHGDGRPEPLLALYHRSVLPVIEDLIAEDRRAVRDLLARISPTPLPVPAHWNSLLMNLNSPADIERWEATHKG